MLLIAGGAGALQTEQALPGAGATMSDVWYERADGG